MADAEVAAAKALGQMWHDAKDSDPLVGYSHQVAKWLRENGHVEIADQIASEPKA